MRTLRQFVIAALLAATALVAVPGMAAAAAPDHVSFRFEGCRPNSTFTGPPFVCADGDYTTGNLGKFWNELDLVPHRITSSTGTDNSSGYTVAIAADYLNGNCGFLPAGDNPLANVQVTQAQIDAGCRPGYDWVSAPVLNPASTGTCTITAGAPRVTVPGSGGTDATIYRLLDIKQSAGSNCIWDYYERLAVGSHLFPGSALHSNLTNENFGAAGIGSKDIPLPVNQITAQSISKTMNATQGQANVWTVHKSADHATLDYPNVCDASPAAHSQGVDITVTWTKTVTAAGGIQVQTQVFATNPAHRAITVHVTDLIYEGSTPVGASRSASTPAAGVVLPAGANSQEVLSHTETYPAGAATQFNDVATATYEDTVTQQPVPGTSTATANANVVMGAPGNDTATIHDEESISGAGLSFSVDSRTPIVGSYLGYTEGTDTTGPVIWNSGTVTTSGSITFHKTVNVTGTASTSGTLTDTATVFGSNGVDVLDSDQLDLPISATGCAPVSEPPPAPPGQQGVAGADIPVNPQQTVLGDTVPIDPGNAHLAGKTGCVRGKFAVSVRGKHINKVVFSIDGKRRASVSRPDAKGRYKIVVDPRKYRPGSHVVTAKTTFEVTSATRPKTMKLRFSRCVRAAAPAFTG